MISVQTLRTQANLFLIALAFFTRIPVGEKINFSQQNLNHASRYFSLVGWIIGAISGLLFLLALYVLPIHIAVVFSMLFTVLLTGSFHEDGLADTCDGFGGGWTKQRKLEIMKDSRLGTYGAVAIWFALTLKLIALFSLAELGFEFVILGLLIAHPLSRSVATSMIFFLVYVSDDNTDDNNAKIKPLAEKQHFLDFSVSLAIGLFALFLATNIALIIIITLVITYLLLAGLFKKQIGGFTGDTLGATQQVSEIVIYLVLIANSSMIDGLWLEGISP